MATLDVTFGRAMDGNQYQVNPLFVGASARSETLTMPATSSLAAAGSDDRAAGTGTHAEAEAVGLGALPVVGLERTLGHDRISLYPAAMAGTRGVGRSD